jgi:hypothetical protein
VPYKSDAQRRFMHAKHPEIASKWDAEIRAKKKHKCGPGCDHVQKNDPFEINKVKVPKIRTGLSGSQKAGRKIKGAASNAYHNATSRGAMNPSHNMKFGQKTPKQPKGAGAGLNSLMAGGIAGTAVGTAVGLGIHNGQSQSDSRTVRQYNRAKRQDKVGKAFKVPKRPHLITEAGTKSRKTKLGDREMLKVTHLIAGGVLGGAAGYANTKESAKQSRTYLNREYRKQGKVSKARLERYTPSQSERRKTRAENAGRSAVGTAALFGGAHTGLNALEDKLSNKKVRPRMTRRGLITTGVAAGGMAAASAAGKYDKKQYRVKKDWSGTVAKQEKVSGGRLAAGYIAPGFHGAVAGKKGKKLRAAGREVGATVGGGLAGGLAATALTRGKSPVASQLGASAGSIAGNLKGTSSTHDKGYYKPLKKNNTISAFGVEHGY